MNGKVLAKGILYGASLIGGIGSIGLAMLEMGDTAKDLKELVNATKDVDEAMTIEVKEA